MLTEVANLSTHGFNPPDNFFQVEFLLHLPGYQLKPVKGSSNVFTLLLCLMYVHPHTHTSICVSQFFF